MFTSESRESEFPSLEGRIYLNTAAEGIPPLSAKRALENYFETKSSGMDGRIELFKEFDTCRASAATLLGFSPEEISFCASTSEAYNLLATAIDFSEGENVIVTDLDFPAGATPWLRLPESPEIRLWKHRDGVLHLDDLESLVDPKTRLVQISLVSFLTGYRVEWAPLRDLVRQKNSDSILAVDVTQAAGRVVLDCLDADCIFASSYKWLLGSHGGCVVAVPEHAKHKVTARAGGWYNLANAFEEDRFTRAESFPGAASFAVGMPSFPAIYTLRAGMDLLNDIGVGAIADHTDKLVTHLHKGLQELGIQTMSPHQPGNSSGIVSFQSDNDEALSKTLHEQNIHIMHQAGRLRVAVHGYNQVSDIDAILNALAECAN